MRALGDILGTLAFFFSVITFGLGCIGYPELFPANLASGVLSTLLGGQSALSGILLADGIFLVAWELVNALQSVI
jgi:hypothetical protein